MFTVFRARSLKLSCSETHSVTSAHQGFGPLGLFLMRTEWLLYLHIAEIRKKGRQWQKEPSSCEAQRFCCCCLVTKSSHSFATPWTVGCQTPLSIGFPRQEYWSGLPFPSPGDLPNPGVENTSSALQKIHDRLFMTEPSRKPSMVLREKKTFSQKSPADSLRPHPPELSYMAPTSHHH